MRYLQAQGCSNSTVIKVHSYLLNTLKWDLSLYYLVRCTVFLLLCLCVVLVSPGDYITLYQAQRDSLKSKFREKDLCIEQLTQEKVSMQVRGCVWV